MGVKASGTNVYREGLTIRAQALYRYALVHSSLWSGSIVINEFPKSGGTWVGQLLSDALGLPFPRNTWPPLRPCVLHGHHVRAWGMGRTVTMWRDGRDVMVSWYYHTLVGAGPRSHLWVPRYRKLLGIDDPDDVRRNLPAFIRCTGTTGFPPGFTWAQFAVAWHRRKGTVDVSYEGLTRNTAGELQGLVERLTGQRLNLQQCAEIVDKWSFERQAGRPPGKEARGEFLRRGVIGDWRRHFTREAAEAFEAVAGHALRLLGYEKDDSWIATTEPY
jgi:hypothetical protein